MLLQRAKQRATRQGVPCTLVLSDIHVPQHCPVLQIPLRPSIGGHKGPKDGSPTLDRLIPAWGYVPNNVVVISHLANRIKSSGTAAQVRRVADWMLTQGLS